MRNALKVIVGLGVAAAATMIGGASARAANMAAGTSVGPVQAVVFVHGTGNYTSSDVVSKYWTQSSIDSMRGGKPYLVVSYQGATCAGYETCAWGSIAQQINSWAATYGYTNIQVVTHSNGSNPVRYLLAHPTSNTGASYGSIAVSSVTNRIKKVVWMAADNSGTVLADKVTTPGTFAAAMDGILEFFGGGYSNNAVRQQRQDNMATYNTNGTFSNGSSCTGGNACYGVATKYVQGTSVYALLFTSAANCGGYGTTTGLKAALVYGWGYSGCSDGFIGCASSSYNGALLKSSAKLNHNQSRRSCDSAGSSVASAATGTWSYETAADFTVTPAELACNATTQGWFNVRGTTGSANTFWANGCPASYRTDLDTDYDCFSAYGNDNGQILSFPDDKGGYPAHVNESGVSVPERRSAGYNATEYASFSCPDSWMGDGICDLCLVAKYGYDASANGGDDCAIPAAKTQACTTSAECNPGVTDPMKYKYYCTAGSCRAQNACSDLGSWYGTTLDGMYEYWAAH